MNPHNHLPPNNSRCQVSALRFIQDSYYQECKLLVDTGMLLLFSIQARERLIR